MPQIVAGTVSGLTKTVSQLVKELLEANWPVSAYDPIASQIGFGLDTWDNYGDIDINVTADAVTSTPMTIGWSRSQVTEKVFVTVMIKSNAEEVPTTMGSAQRMVEQIVKDNAADLGQGVIYIRWDGWDAIPVSTNTQDIWKAVGHVTAMYVLVKV